MTDRGDIDMTAAEFVLGTLDAAERADVAARRGAEPRLERAIGAWERRLAPLLDTIAPVKPSADLLPRIEARIEARLGAGDDARRPAQAAILPLDRRGRRWRAVAVGASALAASLVLAIGVREATRPELAKTFVAVMQKDDASPSFLLTVDLETRLLTIRPVAAERLAGKSYQLWMKEDRVGGPHSLGLVAEGDLTPRATLAKYERDVIEKATFAVSLEPEGGSPTGKPTGPVLFHANLVQVTK